MKLNSSILNKSLVLETMQMEAIKGGRTFTQCGTNNAGLSNSTRDFCTDNSDFSWKTVGFASYCGLADGTTPRDYDIK